MNGVDILIFLVSWAFIFYQHGKNTQLKELLEEKGREIEKIKKGKTHNDCLSVGGILHDNH